jgi:hypothetical protein
MSNKNQIFYAFVHNNKIDTSFRWTPYPDKLIGNSKHKFYATKEEAIAAIREVLPKAEAKVANIKQRLKLLEEELGFELDYTMLGDTHGIYEDHMDIDFTMDGFSFSFTRQLC